MIIYMMYEISNYAKKGYESKHNLNYWNQGYYLGFGVSAASYINGRRYANISNINEYIEKINNLQSVVEYVDEMDKLSTIKEYVILRLRLANGIDVKKFKDKFKIDIFDIFKIEIDDLINKKLIKEGFLWKKIMKFF